MFLKSLIQFRFVMTAVFLLAAYTLPVQAQQTCPAGQHWDTGMNMCMPDTPTTCPSGQHWDAGMKMCMPDTSTTCPTGQHWDDSMHMCMADVMGTSKLDFTLNQYMIGIMESGPLGKTAFSAPNMFMLNFEQVITDCDSVRVEWMGTTDLWTVPSKGTPELLQTGDGFLNAQHPHTTPIMGLTFAQVHCLNNGGDKKMTLFFSPRGEATLGPQAFMMRPSAEGNPFAPLSHHLQDVFHIMSTVLGSRFSLGKWTIEGSIFSGREQNPTVVGLDTHMFDSFGVRVERQVGKSVRIGGSVGSVLETPFSGPTATQPSQRQTAISSWIMTDNKIKSGSVSTSNIWGQYGENGVRLNSFLNELVYRFGDMEKKRIFSRFEILQRTPEQLEINVTGDARHPEWIKKIMFGFEKDVKDTKNASIYVGGSYGKSFVPTDFKATYGGNPNSAEVHVRVQFKKSKGWDGQLPVPASVKSKFGWLHANIIMNKCAMCHTSTMGDGDGLPYANFDSYEKLIESVKPGDPENSVLYRMVKDKKMPRVMEAKAGQKTEEPKYLNDDELQAVYDWIKAGAKMN